MNFCKRAFTFLVAGVLGTATLAMPISASAAALGSTPTFTKGSCGDAYVDCQYVTMSTGDKIENSSDVYAEKGAAIYFEVYTNRDSLFNMFAYVVDGNGTVISKQINAAQKGGSNYYEFASPGTGYYHVRVECGDRTSGRCSGRAMISTDKR
ncbi:MULTISPECIES: hypothetical protein [Paenibacillus]|uniref:hypothetical protein n=1 Tax=Paenibacillus TaxID=44249 RepID=UPI0022B8D989|nr:hypothetical protein [Paenibacillus caseinilyticus]MCZ8520146.1 hypothetical protein [Paenibacillus caseinilyticus]